MCSSLIGNVFRDGATKKADITFQICNQVFSPNYISPQRSNADVSKISIRY
ncbi:hypothetical protein OROHE_015104 [Orobanche hederae]